MHDVITLGGQTYPVAPLTLGQMRRAGPAFMRIGVDTPEAMGAQITLILLSLQAANATITPDQVDSIPGVTFLEIRQAVETVARLMGVELKAVEPGEVTPVAGEPA